MNWRALLVAVLVACSAFFQVSKAAPLENEKVRHLERIKVGAYVVKVAFSEFPIQAERSLDITFETEGGIEGKTGSYKIISPKGEVFVQQDFLPHFPRNRTVWGFDSLALTESGLWKLEFAIKGDKGTQTASLPLEVGVRPVGPSSSLILFLAALPLLALILMSTRAWHQVRPLGHAESRAW